MTETDAGMPPEDCPHEMQPPGLSVSVPAAPIEAVPRVQLTPRVFEACALQMASWVFGADGPEPEAGNGTAAADAPTVCEHDRGCWACA